MNIQCLFNKVNHSCTIIHTFLNICITKNISTYLWRKQCIVALFYKRWNKYIVRSVIGRTLAIQMQSQFLQDKSFVYNTLNVSCLCLFSCSSLQQEKFSWISTSFTNLTNTIVWHLLVKSVDSSTWREKLLFFSLLYPTFPAQWDVPSIHQLIYCFKVEPFHVIIVYLVTALYFLILHAGFISFPFLGNRFCCY